MNECKNVPLFLLIADLWTSPTFGLESTYIMDYMIKDGFTVALSLNKIYFFYIMTHTFQNISQITHQGV